MRGRLWLNLGLALAVAVLALVAWRQPGKAPPPAEIKLTTLDPHTVKRIEFHPPRGDGFALVRDGKDWFIEQPHLRAQPFRVETILELPGATSAARLALADNKDNSFGVDPPQARVLFDDTEIAFGLTNPVGFRRYVRVGDAVHLIDDRWFHHAASKWTDWVDRRLLPDGVTLTRVQLPDIKLARTGVNWQASPERPGVGADAITALVDEWQRAYAMDVEQAAAPADAKPLRLEWEGGALDLALARDGDEWLLYRRDAPIRYRFSDNQGKRLLELKEPPPPAPGNAAPGTAPAAPAPTASPPESGDD
jgi:hypothetical protein